MQKTLITIKSSKRPESMIAEAVFREFMAKISREQISSGQNLTENVRNSTKKFVDSSQLPVSVVTGYTRSLDPFIGRLVLCFFDSRLFPSSPRSYFLTWERLTVVEYQAKLIDPITSSSQDLALRKLFNEKKAVTIKE